MQDAAEADANLDSNTKLHREQASIKNIMKYDSEYK